MCKKTLFPSSKKVYWDDAPSTSKKTLLGASLVGRQKVEAYLGEKRKTFSYLVYWVSLSVWKLTC